MSAKKESALIKFLASYRGKTLFNYFYGFGAAIAILGTLFKILHLDGANVMMAVGLGTEVIMFAISAFEPPFRNYHWEEVFPVLKSRNPEDRPQFVYGPNSSLQAPVQTMPLAPQPMPQVPAGVQAGVPQSAPVVDTPIVPTSTVSAEAAVVSAAAVAASAVADAQTLAAVSRIPHIEIGEEDSLNIENSLKEYAEQMNKLNLHLKGLNTIYEIQLKDISSQIHTIDCINQSLLTIKKMYEGSSQDSDRFVQETEAMAGNLASLNQIYARMLQAMMQSNTPFGGFQAGEASNPKEN